MEQRAYNRFNTVDMKIDISDKVGSITGNVKDVSRYGVCVTNMPRKLFTHKNGVTAIISMREKRFRLQLIPQWEKQSGLSMVTGAIIDDAPSDWTKMVMLLEREEEELWSLTH
jgi:hypothetical protein